MHGEGQKLHCACTVFSAERPQELETLYTIRSKAVPSTLFEALDQPDPFCSNRYPQEVVLSSESMPRNRRAKCRATGVLLIRSQRRS